MALMLLLALPVLLALRRLLMLPGLLLGLLLAARRLLALRRLLAMRRLLATRGLSTARRLLATLLWPPLGLRELALVLHRLLLAVLTGLVVLLVLALVLRVSSLGLLSCEFARDSLLLAAHLGVACLGLPLVAPTALAELEAALVRFGQLVSPSGVALGLPAALGRTPVRRRRSSAVASGRRGRATILPVRIGGVVSHGGWRDRGALAPAAGCNLRRSTHKSTTWVSRRLPGTALNGGLLVD
ncbi:hypothetical protein G9C85_14010 [Halorubellus sp. JP-L1]|uniref:hypothetical protein n=1 Tax=Halorubellus sp. JP-L1 TaxID=2715753 RepID=UPI00140C91CC|nr:hypothetical protein [Halorubellus sp. JP-L1]NHN42737.1 hypothetical protein [Halorubellus sp. JP-L1]